MHYIGESCNPERGSENHHPYPDPETVTSDTIESDAVPALMNIVSETHLGPSSSSLLLFPSPTAVPLSTLDPTSPIDTRLCTALHRSIIFERQLQALRIHRELLNASSPPSTCPKINTNNKRELELTTAAIPVERLETQKPASSLEEPNETYIDARILACSWDTCDYKIHVVPHNFDKQVIKIECPKCRYEREMKF